MYNIDCEVSAYKDSQKGEKQNMQKVLDALVNVSSKLAQSRILQTIQRAFMKLMPLTMIGGFASLFKGLEIGGYQTWLQSTPLYNALGTIYQFTVGLLGLYCAFLVAASYADVFELKKSRGTEVGLVSLVCFLIVTPYTLPESLYGAATLSTSWLGSSGMFTAIIISFITGIVFSFCEKHNLGIRLPDSVPPMIAMQFNALIPGLFAVVIFSVINVIFSFTALGSLQQAVYSLVSAPLNALGANIFGVYVLTTVCYMMWFFGIHGGMTIMPVMMVLFMPLQMANLAAYQAGAPLPNMVTGNLLSYGSGSLPLVIAALIFCKSSANRSLTKLALLPSLFGVDEPAYFGMPMILNPIFFIPWVIITPAISVWGTYLLQCLGLLGAATGASAGSFVPFVVTNLVSYGISGLIWGCLFFIIDVIVYIPFVKAYDRQMLAKEADNQ